MELEILHIIQGWHTSLLNPIMIILSMLGEYGMVWIILSIGMAVIPKTRKCGLTMLAAMAFSFLIGNVVLKNIIARPRPCAVDKSVSLLVPFPNEYSFPSGHTLNGFTASITLFYFYHIPGIITIFLASLIAFSRLYLFVHYPTDILGGILLGIFDSCLIIWATKRLEKIKLERIK